MAYTINRYNGSVLASVEDGTINQTTELKLVGRNFAGYGEAQNENFLHLLENFASTVPPSKPINGMLWFDTNANKIKFWDGARWRVTGSAEVGVLSPDVSVEGDLWWNSNSNQLYARSSNGDWILVGPQSTELGATQLVSRRVTDVDNIEHDIIEAQIATEGIDENGSNILSTIFIISDDQFILNTANIINGFDEIKRGVTLKYTESDKDGVTNAPAGEPDPYFWGTSSNALKLGGKLPEEYVVVDELNFPDSGITIGEQGDLLVFIENGDDAVIHNVVGDQIVFRIQEQNVAVVTSTGLMPGENNTYDIGSTTLRWETIYATNFDGTSTRTNYMRLGTTYVDARIEPVPNTIAARDNNGNLRANLFQGTSTSARYADLAEKYTTDKEYPVGTVMSICDHAGHEAEACKLGELPIGVISEKPAYLMNDSCPGQAIGLKGRVPVRVVGPVKKGQAVYTWDNGTASTNATNGLVGIALETNESTDEKLVECVLKV